MTSRPTDDALSGWLPLSEAVRLAAAAWECEHEIARDRLRRYLTGGSVKSKMHTGSIGKDNPRYEDLSSETWAKLPWHDIRRPIFVHGRDLEQLLQRLGACSPRDIEAFDDAILLHLYDQISEPSSKVPIGPLTNTLNGADRAAVVNAFVRAVQARLFDDKKLEYLSKGQWSPLNSSNVQVAIEVAGGLATFERRYVMMAALPLEDLRAWADKFDISLPPRLLKTADGTNEAKKISEGRRRGAKKNVDADRFWTEVYRLVDDGTQADPRNAGHTVDNMADEMRTWAKRNMQSAYARSTIKRYLEETWAELQERSLKVIPN